MKVLINHIVKLPSIITSAAWCFSLSWKSSKFYTSLRIIIEVITPLMTITATYTAKYLIDLLAGEWVVADATKELLFLFSLLLGIALLRVGTQKAKQYCQVINDELINEKVALMMMEHSLTTDLEYFDDPDYYEKLMSSNRDSAATTTILWNSLAWISACISFCVAIFALAQTNLLYGLFLVAAAVPSSIVSAKYTKMRYALSLDQINELRKII